MSTSVLADAPQGEFTPTMNTTAEEVRKRPAEGPAPASGAKRLLERLSEQGVVTKPRTFEGVRLGLLQRKDNGNLHVLVQGPKLLNQYKLRMEGRHFSMSTLNMNTGGKAWSKPLKITMPTKNTTVGLNPAFGPQMMQIADSLRVDLLETWGFKAGHIELNTLISFLCEKFETTFGEFFDMFATFVAQGCMASGLDPVGSLEVGQPPQNTKVEDAPDYVLMRLTQVSLKTASDVDRFYACKLPPQMQGLAPGTLQVWGPGRSSTATVNVDHVELHPEALRFYIDKNGAVRGELTWRVIEIEAHTPAVGK